MIFSEKLVLKKNLGNVRGKLGEKISDQCMNYYYYYLLSLLLLFIIIIIIIIIIISDQCINLTSKTS